jgi:hypothetical protein
MACLASGDPAAFVPAKPQGKPAERPQIGVCGCVRDLSRAAYPVLRKRPGAMKKDPHNA